VLVEECEEGEMEAAAAVVQLMYEAELPPGLSTLHLAQVRAACELCCLDTIAHTQLS
jgi:alkylhydroperoxidase family enzyme